MSVPELKLTETHAIIFADLVCNRPVKQTMDTVGLSKTQIVNVRNKIKKFLRKDFDHNLMRTRVFGLAPLVVKNIAQFLLEGDKEVTLACAKGWGFLPKDHDELNDIFAAIAAVRGDTHVHVNIGDDSDGHKQHDADIGAIFRAVKPVNRFDSNDN